MAHGRPSTVTSSSHPPAATWRRAWRVSAATFGRPTMRACGLLVARPRLIDQRLRRSPSRLRARGGSSTLDFSADPGRLAAAGVAALPQRPRRCLSRKLFCNFSLVGSTALLAHGGCHAQAARCQRRQSPARFRRQRPGRLAAAAGNATRSHGPRLRPSGNCFAVFRLSSWWPS